MSSGAHDGPSELLHRVLSVVPAIIPTLLPKYLDRAPGNASIHLSSAVVGDDGRVVEICQGSGPSEEGSQGEQKTKD